jgi:hypothetical protein
MARKLARGAPGALASVRIAPRESQKGENGENNATLFNND